MSECEERKQEVCVHTGRSASPDFSCVSIKSDRSMFQPPTFSDEADVVISDFIRRKRQTTSPDFSCVSMKSDRSMFQPPTFSKEEVVKSEKIRKKRRTTTSPDFSCVSMKSDRSMFQPPTFSKEADAERKRKRSASPDFSCVSMKSDRSMFQPPTFSEREDPIRTESNATSRSSCSQSLISLHNTHTAQQHSSHHPELDVLLRVKERHKTSMKKKYESLFEGVKLAENQTLLNKIYTQLYIIEGESEGVNEEHEVIQMETRSRNLQDSPINCNDIFQPLSEAGGEEQRREKKQIKTVLTKGIAGIGKTVSVQKFIQDWAEEKANQDVDFVFVLPFRELNLIKDHHYSLERLLLDFHPELQDLNCRFYEERKVVFIFDGLDESRMTLRFSDSERVSAVTQTSSLNVLMSNLLKGEVLPSALIWITSRPAAASQIPSKHIQRVTEIQGFTDPQKEEYFRKRITEEHRASEIISHIRRSRSLHIMCHIPVFCWISATVLQNIRGEIPQTLTEMYIHFLLIQISTRKQKYEENVPEKRLQSSREVIVKLADLAFRQLMKGNVMFYEEDLIESGIDVTEASVYSGICTEIFREESVFQHRKVFSFVHLSFQDFFAAFYVFFCYLHKKSEVLKEFLTGEFRSQCEKVPLDVFLRAVVHKALKSETGHLDLFLRFLHGVTLESNQKFLQDLLFHTENNPEIIKRITRILRCVEKVNVSAERWLNHSLCLIEMRDTSDRKVKLTPIQCSTLANIILMSEEVLDEFDMKQYNIRSEDGRIRLILAVRNCRKALLSRCNLTDQICGALSSVLQSSNSSLRELDLSNNDLQDSGVKLISAGLSSLNCHIHTLRLSGCLVTEEGCAALASALRSNPHHLRELDLSYNHPGETGLKMISDVQKLPACRLQLLSADHVEEFRMTSGPSKYAVDLTLDPNTASRYLLLSENNTTATRVTELQSYPDHPDRFTDDVPQVLSRESLSGRCYWETEWSGNWTEISVTDKGIERKGEYSDSRFGQNNKSWSLIRHTDRFTAVHDDNETEISGPPNCSNRVGVFLDCSAGTLSFYSVSNTHTLTHLHTFTSTFTHTLHAGFFLYQKCSSVSVCHTKHT